MARRGLALLLQLLLLVAVSPAGAQQPLRVGVKPSPPFILVDAASGKVEGFSADLVRELAGRLEPKRSVEFVVQPDLATHLAAVQDGTVDLGISATTITAERERLLDFTQPFFQGGLGILVPATSAPASLFSALFSADLLWLLLAVIGYVIFCAHLIWFAERGSPAFDDRWRRGVEQGIWWVVVTMSTVGYGDIVPKKSVSKILAVVIIFSGIALFGVAVASFSSALTLARLQSDIEGPDELAGRPVAVVADTIGARAMEERGARLVPASDLAGAVALMERGEAVAVVHDLPLLRYFRKTSGGGRFVIAGGLFDPSSYGITLPDHSALREPLDIALLELMSVDAPLYRRLKVRWFGAPGSADG